MPARLMKYGCALFAVVACTLPPSAQSPEDILATFELHPEFRIELVAMEPVIVDPVDIEFDEHGRAFVIEMPGYPRPESPGTIVLLGDEDHDGVYETRTEFAEGFAVADSIMPYNDGLLVASPPDLLFIKDTDGDNRADVEEVLVSGFPAGNQQHNFNGLQYGLDNWIYGANGGNGGSIYWAGDKDNRVSIARDDFRIHPPTKSIQAWGQSTGGFEIAFDDRGRFFGTHNLVHISHLVFPRKYLDHLPFRGRSTLHQNISDHSEGETARIFPIGIQETRVNHPEQSGYFSGACGITYYGGGAFPSGFENNVFLCDVVLNLIHRDVISADGASLRASRARERVDFLASRDRAFRPVNMTVGPDGALYIVDMHRDVIEHPEWIPDELEENLDVDAGKDKGRIFRVSAVDTAKPPRVAFNRDAIGDVVGVLAHPNKWARDTAQRLLVQWKDPSSADAVRALYESSENPTGRLHALWTLEGLGALDTETLTAALGDAYAGVRENAVIIAETRVGADTALRTAVERRLDDDEPRVRMQTALTMSTLAKPPLDALLALAERDIEDEWSALAIYAGLSREPIRALHALSTNGGLVRVSASQEIAGELARLVAHKGAAEDLATVLNVANAELPDAFRVAVIEGVTEGIGEGAVDLQDLQFDAGELFQSDSATLKLAAGRLARKLGVELGDAADRQILAAGEFAIDAAHDKRARLDQLKLFELAPYEHRADVLFALLDKSHSAELQRAAIEQLERVREPEIAERLIAVWDTLGRQALNVASDILLYQRENHPMLLTALEEGDVPLGQMNLHLERRRFLLRSRNEDTRKRAAALFTDAGVVTRGEAIEKMRPSLQLAGDPARGREVFAELCIQCHEIGGDGTHLGPSLTDIFRKSPETLMHDILDPNAAVDPEYISFAIETVSGEFYSGVVANETDESVTLREAQAKETTVARTDIQDMYSGGLSIMPEELETGMDHQMFADLLAYLLQPR